MITNEKVIEKISVAINAIEVELQNRKEMDASPKLLEEFKGNLEKMRNVIQGKVADTKIDLGMGRVIVDSWPLDSKLGGRIIAAEHSYKKLLKQKASA